MKFLGRKEELKRLGNFYASSTDCLSLVYGRRRIGKSELLRQSLRGCPQKSLYYECKQTTDINNTMSLSVLISETFDLPQQFFSSFEAALAFLFKRATKEPIILILDEYPFLRGVVKGIDSILQSLVDTRTEDCTIKIVICGSSIETMQSLLGPSNPLYGRVDLTIFLQPMDYRESALFYAHYSPADRIRMYAVLGGVPFYNKLVDDRLSVKENIIRLVASPSARLETEIAFNLKSEISRINSANEVFETLASGFSKFSDILSQSHIEKGPTLVDVLSKLTAMRLVHKVAPINDECNRRKSGYYIADNLSFFYYRYIFRFLSQLSTYPNDIFFDKYIERDFESKYVPKIFEDICKQYLILRNRQGENTPLFSKIGKYWYDDPVRKTNGEFDIVTEDNQGYTFYEAKFRHMPVTQAIIEEEIEQVDRTLIHCYRFGFFSKSGFSEEINCVQPIRDRQISLFTLEDLYDF